MKPESTQFVPQYCRREAARRRLGSLLLVAATVFLLALAGLTLWLLFSDPLASANQVAR